MKLTASTAASKHHTEISHRLIGSTAMAIDLISPAISAVVGWIMRLFGHRKPRGSGGIQVRADHGSQAIVNPGAVTVTNSPGATVVGTIAVHGRPSAPADVVPLS